MSKINEMIKELCPNGVERVPIGSIIKKKSLKAKKYHGKAEVYAVTKSVGFALSSDLHDFDIFSSDTSNYNVVEKNDFAYNPSRLNIGSIAYFRKETAGLVSPMYVVFSIDINKISPEYLFQNIRSQYVCYKIDTMKEEGARFRFDFEKWNKIEIPLPPLPIQQEIVNILDKFSSLIDNLDETIQLRQKQYEYYREKLLTFEDGECEWKKLGDCCNVQAGGTPSRKNENYWKNGTIKWLGSTVCQNVSQIDTITDYITEEGYNKSSARLMHDGTTLIALVGATIGKTAYLTFDATINQNIAGVFPMDTNELSSRYIYYYSHKWYNEFTKLGDGKMAMANMSFVRGLVIPVPPLNRQQEIVATLDKFEALISNLKQERELRQKQYEFYREKLLTFE